MSADDGWLCYGDSMKSILGAEEGMREAAKLVLASIIDMLGAVTDFVIGVIGLSFMLTMWPIAFITTMLVRWSDGSKKSGD